MGLLAWVLMLSGLFMSVLLTASVTADTHSEIYAMHFPDVSSLPCPLVDDVRLYDSVTRVYNKILDSSRSPTTKYAAKLSDLHCLAGTDHYFADSYQRISMTLFDQGYFVGSIQYCVIALTRTPYLPHCWNVIQESYYRLGNFEKAFFYSTYMDLVFPDHSNICYAGNRAKMLVDEQYINVEAAKNFHASAYLSRVNREHGFRGNLIDIVDVEIYTTALEFRSNNNSYDEASTTAKCNNLFQQTIQDALKLHFGRESSQWKWPHSSVIKIYYPDLHGFQVSFAESSVALSQHLSLLGIPHKIVSTLPPKNADDHSLFIFLHGTPYSNIFDRLPKNYIFWNFEAHPKVAVEGVSSSERVMSQKGDEYFNPGDIGFGVDPDTMVDLVVYPSSFIEGALAIWEASMPNVEHWERAFLSSHFEGGAQRQVPVFWVPPLTLISTIETTCVLSFPEVAKQSANAAEAKDIDFGAFDDCAVKGRANKVVGSPSCDEVISHSQPVDVLFYGDGSPYRKQVLERLQQTAIEKGWNFQSFLRYNLVGTVREAMIRQAKVVVNLNTIQSAAAPLKIHRIRTLLAYGKAVVSERGGYSQENEHYQNAVVFVDGIEEMIATIEILVTNTAERQRIEKAAKEFAIREMNVRSSSILSDFWNLRLASLLETKVGLLRGAEADLSFQNKLDAIPTQVVSFPTAIGLFSYAMTRAHELFFSPCSTMDQGDSSGIINATNCDERRFAIPNSNPSTQAGLQAANDRATKLEDADMSFTWAIWKCSTQKVSNAAFVYGYSSRHYRNIILSRDQCSGIRSSYASAATVDSSPSVLSSTANLYNMMDTSVLLGYLQRRYQYSGRYLVIGCSSIAEKNTHLDMSLYLDYVCIDDEFPHLATVNVSSSIYLKQIKQQNMASRGGAEQVEYGREIVFDLVYVDGIHESGVVFDTVMNVLDILSVDGTIVISNGRPRYKMEAVHPNEGSFFWSGDVWKSLVKLSKINGIDVMLGDFEWGVAIVKKRPNKKQASIIASEKPNPDYPDFSPQTEFHGISYGEVSWLEFTGETDQLLPLLSLTEIHYWLF